MDENKKIIKNSLNNSNEIINDNDNKNLIKNLKYEINFNKNQKYILSAEESNVEEEDGIEVIYMQKVKAIFYDENNNQMIITSNTGVFNSLSYDSKFDGNVKINYDNHKVVADIMELNFIKKIIKISENVIYSNANLILEADIVSIDLITKKTEIFMKNNSKKVMIKTN